MFIVLMKTRSTTEIVRYCCFFENTTVVGILQRRPITSHRVHRTRSRDLEHRVQRIDQTVSDARMQRIQSRVSSTYRKLWLQGEQHTAVRRHFKFPQG